MSRLHPDSLFGRAFILITALLLVSLLAWSAIYQYAQREPLANEIAQQAVSVVNLTRAAILHADPQQRIELLHDMNDSEQLRVYLARPDEHIQPVAPEPLTERIAQQVRHALGPETRIGFARDGVEGFWVSFFIGDDEFWVQMPRERVQPDPTRTWLGWAVIALLLSVLGAWAIATRINEPLARLTQAAHALKRGEPTLATIASGPHEVRTLTVAFNQLAGELARLYRERATVLAGISHDLRTPLARLRLAIELSASDPALREGMALDIEEMDQIIGQFMAFARGEDEALSVHDLDALLLEVVQRDGQLGRAVHTTTLQAGRLPIAPLAIRRAIRNLIDNALRYAGEPIEVAAGCTAQHAWIEVRDRGPGIPAHETVRMQQPFTRLQSARTDASGAGLGLAIVARVAQLHHGALHLLPRAGGGLVARLELSRSSHKACP